MFYFIITIHITIIFKARIFTFPLQFFCGTAFILFLFPWFLHIILQGWASASSFSFSFFSFSIDFWFVCLYTSHRSATAACADELRAIFTEPLPCGKRPFNASRIWPASSTPRWRGVCVVLLLWWLVGWLVGVGWGEGQFLCVCASLFLWFPFDVANIWTGRGTINSKDPPPPLGYKHSSPVYPPNPPPPLLYTIPKLYKRFFWGKTNK